MTYDKDEFIFGLPIETEFGKVRFLTYLEYLRNLEALSYMNQNVLHIYYQYKSYYDKVFMPQEEKDLILNSLEELKTKKLFELVVDNDNYRESYEIIFKLAFSENNFTEENYKVLFEHLFSDEESFMRIRKLVLEMQVMTEIEVSPNPEIQKGIERSRRVKQANQKQGTTYSDIVSSIVVGTGIHPKEIADMSVLLVYSIYYRIGQFQNYNTSTLFATVAEKVQIDSWNKHIDLFEEESNVIDKKDFENKFGSMF